MATWGMQRCYKSMMNGDWRRTRADKAQAGIMAWTGVRVCGLAVGGCRYGGAPWPQEQLKEVLGQPTCPGRKFVGV